MTIENTPWSLVDLPFIAELLDTAKSLNNEAVYSDLIPIRCSLEAINYDYRILRSKDYSDVNNEANSGNPVAMFRLGELYEYSMGVEEDIGKANYYYNQSADLGFILAQIKIGSKNYESLSERMIENLHALDVVQVDLLHVEDLLRKDPLDVDTCMLLYKKITRPLIFSGRLYSHAGLITNLALLMLKSGLDKKVPSSMLEVASKAGYSKATLLLTQI